jgi:hypothetical protein
VPAGPIFEPYALLSADEAAACNVLEFIPLAAAMLPQQLPAAASNANGALSFTIGLHVPGSSSSKAVVCSGGCLGDQQLAWNKRCRVYLAPATVQALKVSLQRKKQRIVDTRALAILHHVWHVQATYRVDGGCTDMTAKAGGYGLCNLLP